MSKKTLFKVIFIADDKVYELYARYVCESGMMGFIEVDELVFGETSELLVDPGEERLKAEFGGVKRSYIPMHSVLRIDEVEKEGVAKISDCSDKSAASKVTKFPGNFYSPDELK